MADIIDAGAIGQPTEKVTIHVRWDKLNGKPNSVCEVYQWNGNSNNITSASEEVNNQEDYWKLLGETEIIPKCSNPVYVTHFPYSYHFEKIQRFRFIIHDVPAEGKKKLLGVYEEILSNVIVKKDRTVQGELTLKSKKKEKAAGTITISLDVMRMCNDFIHFDLKAINLPSKVKWFCFGHNNPFYKIERSRNPDDEEFVPVITSKHKK